MVTPYRVLVADHLDIAWFVGLFEGEGWIGSDPAGRVRLTVKMTDEDVVRRCHEATGVGTITGPYARGIHKPQWAWCVTRQADAVPLLEAMRPLLGQRRGARADEALARRRERPQVRPGNQAHGTHARYMQHRAEGAPPCDACREAKRASDRKYYQRDPAKYRARVNYRRAKVRAGG